MQRDKFFITHPFGFCQNNKTTQAINADSRASRLLLPPPFHHQNAALAQCSSGLDTPRNWSALVWRSEGGRRDIRFHALLLLAWRGAGRVVRPACRRARCGGVLSREDDRSVRRLRRGRWL